MPLTISSVCKDLRPSATLRLNAMVAEKKAQGADVIGLAAGEPDFATPEDIRQAGKQAIDSGKTRYTASGGIPELKQGIAAFLDAEKGLRYKTTEVIVGAGAKQVLAEALQAVLDPGDEVLLPTPCWLSYPEMVRMAGGTPIPVPFSQELAYVPSADALEAAVTDRTKAIIINTPNNPTGSVWGEEALRSIAELARKHDFYIISDEVYETLVYDGKRHLSVASLSDDAFGRTLVVSGFSKTFAMTGWRLGYATGPRQLIRAMDAYQSHAAGNPCSIAQYAGLEALTGDRRCVQVMRDAFEQRRDLMLSLLEGIPGISCFKPSGAFYVLVDVSGLLGLSHSGAVLKNDTDIAERLLESALVSVVPGEPFFAPGYIRLSYAISEDRIREAMRRIAAFVGGLKAEAA